MPLPKATAPVAVPASPRIKLAAYLGVVVLAVAVWLLGPQLLPQPEQAAPAASPVRVDVGALDAIDRDLQSWSQLLADPRLEQLQPASQLQPARPGNVSPFVRQVAPAL